MDQYDLVLDPVKHIYQVPVKYSLIAIMPISTRFLEESRAPPTRSIKQPSSNLGARKHSIDATFHLVDAGMPGLCG